MSDKWLQKDKRNVLIILFILCVSLSILPVRIAMGEVENYLDLIGSWIASFVLCLTIWYLLVGIHKYERIHYTWLKIVAGVLMAGTLSLIFFILHSGTVEYSTSVTFIGAFFGRGSLVAVIYLPLVFFLQLRQKLQQKEREMAKLKQSHIELQIENLRSKLEPHFLFNTLNVLKSGTNDMWAKEYTLMLSSVFRYLTDNRKEYALISVSSELDFIHSYIYILKSRFGDQVNMHVVDSMRHTEGKVPSLTLQLLIENAVKHNVISMKNPLKIDILLENNWITVRNNLTKRKTSDYISNGIGLNIIREQYRLISGKEIYICNDGKYFSVEIPVL